MRDSFLKSLTEQAKLDENIVLLTADLGYGVFEEFEETFKNQYFNVGVAEQNMTSLAVGLAMEGKKVVTYSIGNFPTLRCLEQIRNDACYHNVNITVVCSGGGFSYGALGMSHHATEDLSILRALPGMTVTAPCTPWETQQLTKLLINQNSVSYLRLDKSYPIKEAESKYDFKLSKYNKYRTGNDFSIFAIGGVLEEAIKASDILKKEKINVRVIGIHTIKPLNKSEIIDAALNTKGIISIEENNIIGGLGSAIAELFCNENIYPYYFKSIGLNDEYSSIVGSQKYLRDKYKINDQTIIDLIKKELKRK